MYSGDENSVNYRTEIVTEIVISDLFEINNQF